MKIRSILKAFLGVILFGGFIANVWNLFGQFLGGVKTVAISFEETDLVEFPSFAFCDSKAFTKRIGITSNVTLYNSSTFNVEVSFMSMYDDLTGNYSTQYFPTMFNGYCKLFDFTGKQDFRSVQSNIWMVV